MSQPSSVPATQAQARPYIGGQAVLEGVMMRAPTSFAVVVRRKDGSLVVRERAIEDGRKGVAAWPFVRGVTALVESLKLGGEALRFSAEQMEKDFAIEESGARTKASVASSARSTLSVLAALRSTVIAFGLTLFTLATGDVDAPMPALDGETKKKNGAMGVMLVFSVGFFIALPQLLAMALNGGFHLGLEVQSPKFQLITGVCKLAIVVGYLCAIRRIPDIRRVFQYHGAEHKTISTYEANEELTVENARKKTTLHPRCGTTFLVMVALVSIVVFVCVGALLPRIHTNHVLLDNLIFFLEKLPFLVPLAAITFELQRIFARHFTKGPLRAVLYPGFLVQKITTIEPDDDQLEIALASLKATLFRELGKQNETVADVTFADFASLSRAESLRAA